MIYYFCWANLSLSYLVFIVYKFPQIVSTVIFVTRPFDFYLHGLIPFVINWKLRISFFILLLFYSLWNSKHLSKLKIKLFQLQCHSYKLTLFLFFTLALFWTNLKKLVHFGLNYVFDSWSLRIDYSVNCTLKLTF